MLMFCLNTAYRTILTAWQHEVLYGKQTPQLYFHFPSGIAIIIALYLPLSPPSSLVLTKLRSCDTWCGKSAANGVERNNNMPNRILHIQLLSPQRGSSR